MLPVLIVSSGGQRFAIPQANLVEVTRLPCGTGTNSIEQVCGAPVYRLRDRLLHLCFLDRELHLESSGQGVLHIVVLEAGAGQFGLVVDAVHDTEEIVVKPVGAQLRAIVCFAGAAILGDGQVVLVLDVAGLAQLAGIVAGPPVQPPGAAADDASEAEDATDTAVNSWLVFRGTTGSRFALPLSAVERLEEIPSECIEQSAGREVVQYRGAILPLLRVARLFHEPEDDRKLLQVAVLRDSGLSAGLVVDCIEDIAEEVLELHTKPHSETRGDLLEGSIVIEQRVTDVLNVKSVLERGQMHSKHPDGSR
jgi:two-component system, chemotaxis family, sensor kinase CheA